MEFLELNTHGGRKIFVENDYGFVTMIESHPAGHNATELYFTPAEARLVAAALIECAEKMENING